MFSTTINQIKKAKQASLEIVQLTDRKINQVLLALAVEIEKNTQQILVENKKDVIKMSKSDSKLSRLILTKQKIIDIAKGIRGVSKLKSPLREVLEKRTLKNGLCLTRVSVPLGAVGVVYEARPNVTPDIFSLCFKSGNACVLKGGKDAYFSHQIFVKLIKQILEKHKINKNCVQLLSPDREVVYDLLNARGLVDLAIARGSRSLIDFVRDNAKVPFIETGAGVVHTYFDVGANVQMGKVIIENAKVSRPAVCNALDTLIVHKSELKNLAELISLLVSHQVEVYADDKAYKVLKNKYPATLLKKASAKDFGREFLSLKMAVKIVNNLQEALDYIAKYSTKHTEAIISNNKKNIKTFLEQVDAAAVYANCATVFTDGGVYGLGAEVGISTQKLHARGPMGLQALTSYKWILEGEGQTRE